MQQDPQIPFALIVEDHPLVAESLVSCVHDCNPGLEVVTAESLRAALDILAFRPAPLLIVTDLTLTDAKGTEAVRQLRAVATQSALLVFTAQDDPLLRREAIDLGAIGYLIKSTSIQILRDNVRAIICGRPWREPEQVPSITLSRLLTSKQLVVLEQLAAGRSNKEIAVRMGISDQTVGSHMKEILSRLSVKNRTEAVVRYFQMVAQQRDRARR
jgi:DNA-binding NarL/FixJ family response regulator